jgi:hypothetical protein
METELVHSVTEIAILLIVGMGVVTLLKVWRALNIVHHNDEKRGETKHLHEPIAEEVNA